MTAILLLCTAGLGLALMFVVANEIVSRRNLEWWRCPECRHWCSEAGDIDSSPPLAGGRISATRNTLCEDCRTEAERGWDRTQLIGDPRRN